LKFLSGMGRLELLENEKYSLVYESDFEDYYNENLKELEYED